MSDALTAGEIAERILAIMDEADATPNVTRDDVKRAIEALLSPQVPPPIASTAGWLPISTAPKDGTEIIIGLFRDDFVDPVVMNSCWLDREERGGVWSDWHGMPEPTHWMPLVLPEIRPFVSGNKQGAEEATEGQDNAERCTPLPPAPSQEGASEGEGSPANRGPV